MSDPLQPLRRYLCHHEICRASPTWAGSQHAGPCDCGLDRAVAEVLAGIAVFDRGSTAADVFACYGSVAIKVDPDYEERLVLSPAQLQCLLDAAKASGEGKL